MRGCRKESRRLGDQGIEKGFIESRGAETLDEEYGEGIGAPFLSVCPLAALHLLL